MSLINLKIAIISTLFIGTECLSAVRPRRDRARRSDAVRPRRDRARRSDAVRPRRDRFLASDTDMEEAIRRSLQDQEQSAIFKKSINPFSEYTDETLTGFNYAKQTEWITQEETVDKGTECNSDIGSNPQSAVECFQKNNPQYNQEIFSVKIPAEMQTALHQKYCIAKRENTIEESLEDYVKEQIARKYQNQFNASQLKADAPGFGDLMRMDSSGGHNNMNHFYQPRGEPIAQPNEKWLNAGPQPFHQDRSSLAASANGKTFLMLYTACAENLDDAKSGTWVSSAANTFVNSEYNCADGASIEECWNQTRRNNEAMLGSEVCKQEKKRLTYESYKFRAPRYTSGDDWTKLEFINEEAQTHIKNLKRFQQIPSIAGNVLVFMEKNILHAGPEVLPKDNKADTLNAMKRVVIRRRLYVK